VASKCDKLVGRRYQRSNAGASAGLATSHDDINDEAEPTSVSEIYTAYQGDARPRGSRLERLLPDKSWWAISPSLANAAATSQLRTVSQNSKGLFVGCYTIHASAQPLASRGCQRSLANLPLTSRCSALSASPTLRLRSPPAPALTDRGTGIVLRIWG
jgi:hypothetical protein